MPFDFKIRGSIGQKGLKIAVWDLSMELVANPVEGAKIILTIIITLVLIAGILTLIQRFTEMIKRND